MQAKVRTLSTLSIMLVLPICLPSQLILLKVLAMVQLAITTQLQNFLKSIWNTAETTQGRVDSIHRQITQMAPQYSTTSMVLLSHDKHTHKVESILIRHFTCPTTTGCMKLARPITTLGIRDFQLPTSRYRTQRKVNKFHNRWHEVRSGTQQNDRPQAALAMQQHLIQFSLNSTKPFLMVVYRWRIQEHKSFLRSVSNSKLSRGTSSCEPCSQHQLKNHTVVLEN